MIKRIILLLAVIAIIVTSCQTIVQENKQNVQDKFKIVLEINYTDNIKLNYFYDLK